MNNSARLTRLLQLASPALPVGAFSYSQGLESAVEAAIVHDAASAQQWIGDFLELSVARMEAPILLRLHRAWSGRDYAAVDCWNRFFIASREAAELRAETLQMGYSLVRLLVDLGGAHAAAFARLQALEEVAFPTAFSCAAASWEIEPGQAAVAYLWAWLENQAMAAVKVVPLGQTDGQRILLALGERVPAVVERAEAARDEDIGGFAPGLAILASQHETQYSRLFRS
jgi:urease accessory protein